jgi:hypothetical protein
VKTTVTLDEEIAGRLQAESQRTGRDFETLVNEYLRVAWAQRKALQLIELTDGRSTGGTQREK